MANQAQPSIRYSVGVASSHPETQSSHPERSPVPPPSVSPGAHRFPPPKFQNDQIPSPSIQAPTTASPANGVKSGSPPPHLSTPPGPPVFSSPVRPAAVPFRASPSTPQPVAFSSGSSLPTSSPPHFSNGSVDLLHQTSDVTEDLTTVGEAPYVLFSAHKVLPYLVFKANGFVFMMIPFWN